MTTPKCSPHRQWRILALALTASMACGSVFAQWQWIDATGRKVFSDTAPPQGIPEKNILKRPHAMVAAPAVEAPAQEAPAQAPKPVAQTTGVDPKLEAKRQAEAKAEAAKRQAEDERRKQARAENCERAKRSLATLQSGVRIRTTNTKGEQEFMSDSARTSDIKRAEEIVRSDCGDLPSAPMDVPNKR